VSLNLAHPVYVIVPRQALRSSVADCDRVMPRVPCDCNGYDNVGSPTAYAVPRSATGGVYITCRV